jgi:hypothetical protein
VAKGAGQPAGRLGCRASPGILLGDFPGFHQLIWTGWPRQTGRACTVGILFLRLAGAAAGTNRIAAPFFSSGWLRFNASRWSASAACEFGQAALLGHGHGDHGGAESLCFGRVNCPMTMAEVILRAFVLDKLQLRCRLVMTGLRASESGVGNLCPMCII